jgi:hypothetical protein
MQETTTTGFNGTPTLAKPTNAGLSISLRLMGLSGLSLISLLAMGFASRTANNDSRSSFEEIHLSSEILATQLDADMMHDALRGDVLSALLATRIFARIPNVLMMISARLQRPASTRVSIVTFRT